MNLLHSLTDAAVNLFEDSVPSYSDFKTEHTYVKRLEESTRIKNKYPERLPIICQRMKNCNNNCPLIDKKKYLVPQDLTVGQFIYVIRKRCNITATNSLFCYINGTIPSTGTMLKQIYEEFKDSDGFLYIYYNTENTFGTNVHRWTQLSRSMVFSLQRFIVKQITNTSGNNQEEAQTKRKNDV
jgi:GABA(A) receptor-associated protein